MSSVSLINGHIDDDNYVGDITHNVYVKVVEEADQMLLQTIQRIGNEYKLNFLVDKSKVIEALTDYQRKINGAADLVEVVRCKDCERCEHNFPVKAIDNEAIEGWLCKVNGRYVSPTDYCSYGERRDK